MKRDHLRYLMQRLEEFDLDPRTEADGIPQSPIQHKRRKEKKVPKLKVKKFRPKRRPSRPRRGR